MSQESCSPSHRKLSVVFILCAWTGLSQIKQILRNWSWGFGEEYTGHQQISQFSPQTVGPG